MWPRVFLCFPCSFSTQPLVKQRWRWPCFCLPSWSGNEKFP